VWCTNTASHPACNHAPPENKNNIYIYPRSCMNEHYSNRKAPPSPAGEEAWKIAHANVHSARSPPSKLEQHGSSHYRPTVINQPRAETLPRLLEDLSRYLATRLVKGRYIEGHEVILDASADLGLIVHATKWPPRLHLRWLYILLFLGLGDMCGPRRRVMRNRGWSDWSFVYGP
jgi:hypothetical protein